MQAFRSRRWLLAVLVAVLVSAVACGDDGGGGGDDGGTASGVPRHDHDRLPGHPQRRPRREERGLAGSGVSRHRDRVDALRLRRLGQRSRRRRQHRHRPGRQQSGVPRALPAHRLPGAVDPRCHRCGRGPGREPRVGAESRRGPGRPDHRHAARLDVTLQPPRRPRGGRRGRGRRRRDRRRTRRHLRRLHTRGHRRGVRVEPEPGQHRRRRGRDPRHQRRPGRRRPDHL